MHTNSVNMITTSLFYVYKNVFTFRNIWMTEKKVYETSLWEKDFNIQLNVEDIANVYYAHAKRVFKENI